MKLRVLPGVLFGLAAGVAPAAAGGLFLPGSGAISTSRAGAAIASVDDGEALSVNPAGLAKTTGWTVTFSAAFVDYTMQFSRRGGYDQAVAEDRTGFEGQPFETVKNDPNPPLGIGSVQPIPVIAVVSDLGGRVKGLRVAGGLYAPNGYPFRDMTRGYKFNEDAFNAPAPPTRYDVMTAESAALFPTLAAAYRILPQLDIGARFSAGNIKSKQSVAIWGGTNNVDEAVTQDTLFTADVKDGFVPTFGVGATFRPTPWLELAAVYNSPATLRAKGTAQSIKGLNVDKDRVVGPLPDDMSRCETGGDFENQKACITTQLPQTATVAARYKVHDIYGALKADLELNVGWENWGKRCDDYFQPGGTATSTCAAPSQILVKLDTGLWNAGGDGTPGTPDDVFGEPVRVNFVNLGLQDTYSIRLGGSYHIPVSTGEQDPAAWGNRIILRGGLSYDTRAARDGWLRASFDGAARVTTTVGVGYRTRGLEINLGGGFVYEGTQKNGGANPDGSDCNPTSFAGNGQVTSFGCTGDGQTSNPLLTPDGELGRQGPDPTSPLLDPEFQSESPYNQGTYKAHYVLFMLGVTKWF